MSGAMARGLISSKVMQGLIPFEVGQTFIMAPVAS